MVRRLLVLLAVFTLLAVAAFPASAATNKLKENFCEIVVLLHKVLTYVGPTIVLLMFLYGGIKYVYSAEDPGGRKQAKNIMIHALIAGILLGLAVVIIEFVIPTIKNDIDACYRLAGAGARVDIQPT